MYLKNIKRSICLSGSGVFIDVPTNNKKIKHLNFNVINNNLTIPWNLLQFVSCKLTEIDKKKNYQWNEIKNYLKYRYVKTNVK